MTLPSPSHHELPTEPLDGGYRLGAVIGAGGFGTVHRGRDARGEAVAIKLTRCARSRDRARALREAAHLAASAHPCVIGYRGQGSLGTASAGSVFLVMELGEGSLEDRLQDGSLSYPELRAVLGDVLDGLDHLHARGLVHGDVKPANVLRVGGRHKLCDLGSTTAPGEDDDEVSGTAEVAAPEALAGAPVAASDLWSVGLLVHLCLTRRSPFRFPSHEFHDILRTVREREPSLDRSLPAPIAALVRGCLVRDPARRWTTADVRRALARLPSAAPPPRRIGLRTLALAACVLLAGLAVGGGAIAHAGLLPGATPGAAR